MNLNSRFLVSNSVFWIVCILTALVYIENYTIILPYTILGLFPLIFYKKSRSKIIADLNVSSFFLFTVWLISISLRFFVLLNQEWEYPLQISTYDLVLFYFGWIASAEFISKEFKSKLGYLVFFLELTLNSLFLSRTFIALFFLALFFSLRKSINIKFVTISFFILFIAFTSTIYIRTFQSETPLNYTVNEFASVIKNGVERPSFFIRSDEKIIEADTAFTTKYSLDWAFKPRILFSEKPYLKPGLEVRENFWKNDRSIHVNSHLPVGFVGSHYLHFYPFHWWTLSLHIILILSGIYLLAIRSNSGYWISHYFVFTQFVIPVNFVFYLTSLIYFLLIFIIFFYFKKRQRKDKTIVLVYSKTNEYGGIQRIVDEIKYHYKKDNFLIKELVYKNNSIFAKVRFIINYFYYSLKSQVFLSTHLHFNKLFKYRFKDQFIITLAHGLELDDKKSCQLAEYSNLVLCNSKLTASKLYSSVKTCVTPYPFLKPLPTIIHKTENPSFLIVGRLSNIDTYKNYDETIKEYLKYSQFENHSTLHIVGDGELKNKLQEKYSTNSNVHFHGFVDDFTLDKLYKSSWAFILLSTKEGQGLSYFEAMSASTPVIGLKESVLSEFIEHKVQGYLLDTIQQLPQTLSELSNNQKLRLELSKNANEYASLIIQESLFFKKLNEELNHVWNSRSD